MFLKFIVIKNFFSKHEHGISKIEFEFFKKTESKNLNILGGIRCFSNSLNYSLKYNYL